MTSDKFANIPVADGPFAANKEGSVPAVIEEGRTMQRTTSAIQAMTVQKPRQLEQVGAKMKAECKLAGKHFYYYWEVKNKRTGKPEPIEGGTINLAMALLRNWGNAVLECNTVETPTHYVSTARMIDLETMVSSERSFRQSKASILKAQAKMGEDRALDTAFQISESKATRNVILRMLPGWLVQKCVDWSRMYEKATVTNVHLQASEVLEFFQSQWGVTVEQLQLYAGKKVEMWTEDTIQLLRDAAESLKAKRVPVHVLFPVIGPDDIEPAPKPEPKPKPKPKPQPKPAAKKAAPPTEPALGEHPGPVRQEPRGPLGDNDPEPQQPAADPDGYANAKGRENLGAPRATSPYEESAKPAPQAQPEQGPRGPEPPPIEQDDSVIAPLPEQSGPAPVEVPPEEPAPSLDDMKASGQVQPASQLAEQPDNRMLEIAKVRRMILTYDEEDIKAGLAQMGYTTVKGAETLQDAEDLLEAVRTALESRLNGSGRSYGAPGQSPF